MVFFCLIIIRIKSNLSFFFFLYGHIACFFFLSIFILISARRFYLCNGQLRLHLMIYISLTTLIISFVGIECRNVRFVYNQYHTVCGDLFIKVRKFIEILDERRVIGGKILHSGCVICAECQKSIGEGAYEQVDLIEKLKFNLLIYSSSLA